MKLNILIPLFFLSAAIFQSCTSTKQLPQNMEDTYYGFFPCADCPGISYTLELATDEFRRTMEYYDRDFTSVSEGTVKYTDGQIHLFVDGNLTDRYEVDGNQLIHLDGDGNRITGELASYYILYRGDPSKAQMPGEWGLNPEEVKYKGTGNEPFWMVQVRTSTLYFKGLMARELEFEIPITQTTRSEDGMIITFHGKSADKELKVQITHETCQDNMSGFYFPTSLIVDLNVPGIHMESLRGCGQYLGDHRLNGHWELQASGNQNLPNKLQTLFISLDEEKINGHAGCNQFFGSIDQVGNTTIRFQNIGSTKMACPDMESEHLYLQFLDQPGTTWEIDENEQLILKNGDHVYTFSRAG